MSEVERIEFSSDREGTRRNSTSESSEQSTDSYLLIPYGFQPRACYKPKAKSKEITGVTYNSRSRQFVILDSKGITTWSHNSVINAVSRLLDYPPYQFNLIRLLLHSKKFNVYFGLSKDYALKVFNINFHEVFSVISDMNSVLCMVFNSVTDELITGGTGGIRFWTFGEIQSDDRSISRDSRPMANYGLILRCEHPAVDGAMVKDIILDEKNQRLYCLSERNVVAYDMKGNFLFEIKSAHQGQVTGCVYSKFSNFVVSAGTDCAVNVWSSNGGSVHSFYSHSKMVTNLLLHPEAPSLVITSSQDGTVKIFSLDIMEELYSQVVFPEGIEWMSFISHDLLYCATSKALQVFSINHVTNFWTTIRCPLRSISLTTGSHGKRGKVLTIAEDYSARFVSKNGHLLSTVLPPPPVTTGQQLCSAHAYCPIYGLMYVLVNQEEIWVYYTKSNPANRVEVWKLSDIQDISNNRESISRNDNNKSCTPVSSRSSPSPFNSPAKIVDGVPCLSVAFLHSTVNLKNKAGEFYPDLTYYLVVGLQDGRLLFTSPFSALILYYQFQATKGTVLSIKHDVTTSLLLLNTITLNKYTIQIRGLPDLDIKHSIDAGNDLTCFVRMGSSFLTGHETGRLILHHLNSEHVTRVVDKRTSDGQKVSKDHLDFVLTVDANNNLQLFSSSSKDGSIKIWNNAKVLLREIILDKTLTTVCFLNSSGDLLAGFKNHVFSISREKAHLTCYCNNAASSRRNSEQYETGSDIYEDPRVRFEYKKVIPSEPVRMETYLVPFANISINLARFLSGQLPQSSLKDDMESETDGTESELSDVFSVAPTDIYMSQSGTPYSRSRSSSPVSSWNLPNIGWSPVSSPPRTPPPFMSPVLELESEDEIITPDNGISESNEHKYFTGGNEKGKTQTSKKTVKLAPVFSRQKRPGLSERKIDSRTLQSTVSVNATKNSLRSKRVEHEDTTNPSNTTTSSRSGRTIVKKTKQQTGKSQRKVVKSQQPSPEENMAENEKQNDPERNSSEESKLNNAEEKETVKYIEEKQQDEDTQESIEESDLVENRAESQSLHEEVTCENVLDQGQVLIEKQALDKAKDKELCETVIEEAFAVKDDVQSVKEELSITTDGKQDELSEGRSLGYGESGENGDNESDKDQMEQSGNDLTPLMPVSRENSLSNDMSNLHLQEPCLQLPSNNTDLYENLEHSDFSEEDRIDDLKEQNASMSEIEHGGEYKNETLDKLTSKSVSFIVTQDPEDLKPRRIIPTGSMPRRKISSRRSVSPVNVTPKVVPVLDSSSNDDSYGQRLHPSSALKIYALAKTRRRTASGRPVVSRSRVKQQSFEKHNTTEESIDGNFTMNDGSGRIPNTFVDMPTNSWVPKTVVDKQGDEVMAETVKDKERRKENKDLIGWCINALSEKAKYPIFSPKPRLRSRRSVLKDEGKSTSLFFSKMQDSNDHQNNSDNSIPEGRGTENERKYERQDGSKIRISFEDKFYSSTTVGMKKFHTESSRHRSAEVNALDYGEGWQERILEKAREMKAKHLERKQKVLQKRLVDKRTLEEKRCLVELYGSTGTHKDKSDKIEGINMDNNGSWLLDNDCQLPHNDTSKGIYMDKHESHRVEGDRSYRYPRINKDNNLETHNRTHGVNMDKKHESRGIDMDKEDRISMDNHGYQDNQPDGKDLNRVRSSYENFKNKPVIIQPYRLEKFNSQKDEMLLQGLNLDQDDAELPDDLLQLITRPKSAPSIPSKCRKYVLVANDSETMPTCDHRPAPTALEEMLMLQRFPKSNLGQVNRSRSCSPLVSEAVRRPYSLQKIQNINMSCK